MDATSDLFACSATFLAPTDQVFDLFANHIGRWWPIPRACADGMTRTIVIEPCVNGRFYEARAEKPEELWGKVAAYVAARTLIIDLELDPEFQPSRSQTTTVEIFFMQRRDGGTHLTIVHAELHRFCLHAQARERFAEGWRHILDAFKAFAETALGHPTVKAQCCGPERLPPGLY